jgi:phytoene dehydrogenase-like protein
MRRGTGPWLSPDRVILRSMALRTDVDAIVVGSGPNGLAAAIAIAQAGRSVRVLEAAPTIGGGARSDALTLPGFRHDVCSAIHPLVAGSPFLRSLPLAEHGLRLVHPEIPLAHPLDDGSAVALHRSVDETADGLGLDADAYRRLVGPLARDWEQLVGDLVGPLRPPRHPLAAARFGLSAVRSATGLARSSFAGERARALFAGNAAHSMQPLEQPTTAAFGLMLMLLGHGVGWPAAQGGSQAIPDAMASLLRTLGGELETGREVRSLGELAGARSVVLDLTPRQILPIVRDALPIRYRRALARYRYGPGVFKLDYALDGPVPWAAAACRRAGTVHLGGTLEEIAEGEAAIARGRHPRRPYVLVAQQSLFDETRAPSGSHTLWAYCHVPNGSTVDMSGAIEDQIERFAPGFRDLVRARHAFGPAALEAHNPNNVGGDINGGAASVRQLFARPALRAVPYSTPDPRLFICSSSTPPGGGVHGMCGFYAARAALRGVLR